MFRYSVSPFSMMRWSLFEDIHNCEKLGYESIGLWRQKIEDVEYELGEAAIENVLEELTQQKLSVSSLHHCGGFTGQAGLSFEEAVADTHQAIQLAHQLQADCLLIHIGGPWVHRKGQLFKITNEALAEVVPIARDYGVRLAIEPRRIRSDNSWTVLHSVDSALETISMYKSSELGIVLDLFEFGDDLDVLDNLPQIVDSLALVQLSDRHTIQENPYLDKEPLRCLLGDGQLPIEQWLNGLVACNYEGAIEVEVYGGILSQMNYADILSHANQFLQQRQPSSRKTIARSTK